MALEISTLNGFMRLGAQVYPERPNAVQVIERGPHGKRMAADPVLSRLGRPRGSGFRFWVEELNVPADESWNPPQRVVGLLGLGDTQPPHVSEMMRCDDALPKPPSFAALPEGLTPAARSMKAELGRVVGAACRGRADVARRILSGSWKYFGDQMTAEEQTAFEGPVGVARAYIDRVAGGGQAAAALARTEEREGDFSARMKAWNEKYGEAAIREEQRMVDAAREGKLSYAAAIAAQDPMGSAKAAVTGQPPARWARGINTEVGVRRARGECVGVDPACWAKQYWLYVVLGGAAIMGVYAFASGLGRGLAGGR